MSGQGLGWPCYTDFGFLQPRGAGTMGWGWALRLPTGTSLGVAGSTSAGPWPGLVGLPRGEEGLEEAPSSPVPGKDTQALPQPRCGGVGRRCSASEGS